MNASKEKALSSDRGFIDFLRFSKGQSYSFYIIPKVTSFDRSTENIEVDYPFTDIGTHFGVYNLLLENNIQNKRINCNINGDGSCPICGLIKNNKGLGKELFKMVVPTRIFLCYVIHEKKIKIAFFNEYLYNKLLEKTSTAMASNNENLVDLYRYKVSVTPEGPDGSSHTVSFADTPGIQLDNKYMNVLENIFNKPLDEYINSKIITETPVLKKIADIVEKTYMSGNEVADSLRSAILKDFKEEEKKEEDSDENPF